MILEVGIERSDVFATARVERDGVCYLLDDVSVHVEMFGHLFTLEMPPDVERKIEALLIRKYEREREYDGADEWKTVLE